MVEKPNTEISLDETAISGRKRFRTFVRIITANKRTTFGFAVLVVLLSMTILAPLIAPKSPTAQNLTNTYKPPAWATGGSTTNLFGTDALGRDIFSRLLYGFGIATYVAVTATFFVGLIGTPIGLLSGYFRGILDEIVVRIVDMWMSFPPVLLSIALILILGNLINNVILAIVLVDWTRFARVIRGEIFNIREKDYIIAARAIGYGGFRIIGQEVFPNIIPLMIVLTTLEMSIAISVEVLLSFVGLGIPAGTPSWGAMIAEGLPYLQIDWWPTIFPLAVVIVVIVGLNLLGDGLREQLDPRLQVIR